MDWSSYKTFCERPDYFSRWAINKTRSLVPELAGSTRCFFEQMLLTEPLEKPADHSGGPETDYFRVDLKSEIAKTIIDELELAQLTLDDSREKNHARHLGVVWSEYLSALSKNQQTS